MVSPERSLPESFEPGKKTREGVIDLVTATNVHWGIKVADALYSTPSVAGGKVFVGGLNRRKVCSPASMRPADKVLPPLGHFQKQWIEACKNGGKTAWTSNTAAT